MRVRRIAILIDGGFFIKRLPKLRRGFRPTPQNVATAAYHLCKRHVERLVHLPEGSKGGDWLDHVYRLFYYDARPYNGIGHHPVLNQRIEFGKTDTAIFREALFTELRRKRKFAIRLGHVQKDHGWQIDPVKTKSLLKLLPWLDAIQEAVLDGAPMPKLCLSQKQVLRGAFSGLKAIDANSVRLGMRQKGVDMRIGLDIASMTLKQQVDTLILVTGDSDFVPAAKLARREGVEFLLDPMWQSVSADLNEHVDGIVSGFPKPHIHQGFSA
jgi:uncharacterized LabA/DUF88 family protein